ncbi:MAG: hypothetical protein V2I43_11250 [Parvularcula sp.]|jgi:hypothetical protein|nr:hypothetical protein [Parvularcula sp.]
MKDDRWEYRIWAGADDLVPLTHRIVGAATADENAQYRTDTYLLGGEEMSSFKLRYRRVLEIKELLGTKGVAEHWFLAVRQEPPYSEDSLARLGLSASAGESPDAVVAAAEKAGMTALPVRKHRRRFSLSKGEAEITEAMFNGKIFTTIGIETPLYEACVEMAEQLGLTDYENVSYEAFLSGHLK